MGYIKNVFAAFLFYQKRQEGWRQKESDVKESVRRSREGEGQRESVLSFPTR